MPVDTNPERLTSKNAVAGIYEPAAGISRGQLIDRLGRHEDVLAALRREYADAEVQIALLRDEGRIRSATYHQLVANRITLKSVLAHFTDAGL